MASIIKTDNIQTTGGANIINQCSTTITLGASGDSIVLGCGATATGFGRSGGVNYCTTAKTTPFTAANGSGYFVNTACGAITVTLPATPSAGAIIALKDYGNTWQTNNVTVCNNGSKINGVCATAKLSTQGQSVTLIYVDATKGWQDINDSTSSVTGAAYITATGGTITTSGDYKIHTFTTDGCFSVSSLSSFPNFNKVDYLVVAGGGGGGCGNNSNAGGGGGAGGFRESCGGASGCYATSPLAAPCGSLTVTASTYPITVGAGGFGPNPTTGLGCNGSNSVFSTITSAGGGGGGGGTGKPGPDTAGSGGSGGGTRGSVPDAKTAGSGNTPPVSPPQGNPGNPTTNGDVGGGGGGGAIAAGTAPPAPPGAYNVGGAGGTGATSSISGTPTAYAGGGGGGALQGVPQGGSPGAGGTGGGGNGGAGPYPSGNPFVAAGCGTANTGGGGGGAGGSSYGTAASGGSGVVIIRYKYQ